MEQKQTVGIREFVAIGVIMVGIKLTDDTPVIYFKKMGNAAWMAPLVSAVFIAILLFLMTRVLDLYEEQNLIDVIFTVFGKFFGWIVVFYLWAALFAALIINSTTYTDLISTMYFPKTRPVIIFGVLMLICMYGAMKGISAIGSTAWTVLYYLKFALFTALIITMAHGQWSFLFPFFGYGEWTVIKESAKSITIYDEFLYLGILSTMLPTKKSFKKGIWIMYFLVIIELTLAMVSFLMIFDFKSIQLINYAWHEVIRYISLGFLVNVETLFFPFWLLGVFIRFAAYLYLTTYMFGRLFKIKQFHLLPPIFATLIIFIGMIPDQPTFTLPIWRTYLIEYTTLPTVISVVLLWIIAKIKTRRKRQHAK